MKHKQPYGKLISVRLLPYCGRSVDAICNVMVDTCGSRNDISWTAYDNDIAKVKLNTQWCNILKSLTGGL